MNADAFRQLYDYHITENRKTWNYYIVDLSQEQFMQPSPYSLGSIRNHVSHLIGVDDGWFSGLKGRTSPENPIPEDIEDRDTLRQYWDKVEQSMREYLDALTDDMLFKKPFMYDEDKDIIAWQALIHVVNHGADHRAQILRLLGDLGVRTGPQDYAYYVYDHLSR